MRFLISEAPLYLLALVDDDSVVEGQRHVPGAGFEFRFRVWGLEFEV